VVACNDVSVTLGRGAVLAITGPNGSGKTSLLNLIAGDTLPDTGTIVLDQMRIERWPVHRRRRNGVSRSYQRPVLFDEWTVSETMQFACDVLGCESRSAWEVPLELCGLGEVRDASVGELTHAERKLIDLALAIVGRPQVILVDEPCAGVGEAAQQSIIAALLFCHTAWQPIIVVVEHRREVLRALMALPQYVHLGLRDGVPTEEVMP